MADKAKAERELRALKKEEVRKWREDRRSYRPPPEFKFQNPFWPPVLRRGRKGGKSSSRTPGPREAFVPKTPHPPITAAPASQNPKPRTARGTSTSQMCNACGKPTSVFGHFVYKNKTFCEATSSELTLEDWMKQNVPKTTRWRWKVKQKATEDGVVQPRKERTCSLCKKRMLREMGHSIHIKTRKTFCEATDSFGRTVEEWLTEIRKGITTADLKQQNLERWGQYKYKPDVRVRYNQKRREKRAEEAAVKKKKKKKEQEM
ncbi:uncharacterized protein [Pagrus major]